MGIGDIADDISGNGKTIVITSLVMLIVFIAVSTLVFFISLKSAEQVMVPNVVGKDLPEALLDLQARKQWRVVGVEFEPRQIVRHHITHKFRYLLVNFGVIHQNFGNIGAVIIADGANNQ